MTIEFLVRLGKRNPVNLNKTKGLDLLGRVASDLFDLAEAESFTAVLKAAGASEPDIKAALLALENAADQLKYLHINAELGEAA